LPDQVDGHELGQDEDQAHDQDMQEPKGEDEASNDNEEGQDDPGLDKEIEAILRRAQERSDEHEADKKARIRKAPLPPNERDW
ncbi:MAG: hypothetical protein II946_01995, partial [Kiritimatiellae bacterium]|nr:hypothetical protein [Kiritimatiellia bacterium]